MTILVDAAIWPWRGRRWAHLISDCSYDELHDFAVSIGTRRVGFQGDHYDIDSDTRVIALQRGAVDADSRLIVRRLRESGLRIGPGQKPPSWQWLTKQTTIIDDSTLEAAVFRGVFSPTPHRFARALTADLMGIGAVEADLLGRPAEVALILSVSAPGSALRVEISDLLASRVVPDEVSVYVSGHGELVLEVLETREPSQTHSRLEARPAVSSHP